MSSIWVLPAEAVSPAARLAAEDFLVAEAALLDDRRFDEWLALFTDDLEYVVPVRTIRRRGNGSDVDWESRHYDDNKASMSLRVRRLTETDVAWAEDPPSFTRRMVTNFRYAPGPGDAELTVRTNLLLFPQPRHARRQRPDRWRADRRAAPRRGAAQDRQAPRRARPGDARHEEPGSVPVRVIVDLGRCNAYANCLMEAPDVFDLDDATGLVRVLQEHPPAERRDKVLAAARVCPVQAISVEE